MRIDDFVQLRCEWNFTCLKLLRFLDLFDFIVCAIHCPEGFIKNKSQPKVKPDLVRTWLYLVNQVGPSSAFIKHCFYSLPCSSNQTSNKKACNALKLSNYLKLSTYVPRLQNMPFIWLPINDFKRHIAYCVFLPNKAHEISFNCNR